MGLRAQEYRFANKFSPTVEMRARESLSQPSAAPGKISREEQIPVGANLLARAMDLRAQEYRLANKFAPTVEMRAR